MGPMFLTILCCLLALVSVIFRSVLDTPPAHSSARPGSHNKCKYLKSLSSPSLSRPSTTFPSTTPLISDPTEVASLSSIASMLPLVSLYTDASRISPSAPGPTIHSPSEHDCSMSANIVTSGLQQFILYYRYYCDC